MCLSLLLFSLSLLASSSAITAPPSDSLACPSSWVDGYVTPSTTNSIDPIVPVTPFYQWENNDGYCGEVTVLQTFMALGGTWMSQFNLRLLCGATLNSVPAGENLTEILPESAPNGYPNPMTWTVGMSLNQSGPDQWCETFKNTPNYNAQMEFESPDPGVVSGSNDYSHAEMCVRNAQMEVSIFGGESQLSGLAGYEQFISWIKGELIAGKYVGIGVLISEIGTRGDSQYDHEVTVTKIGTNHDPLDASYYPDDVLYIEDHGVFGVYTSSNESKHKMYPTNPSIPPGAGGDKSVCTPYIYGYRVSDLPHTRVGANLNSQIYDIILPGTPNVATQQGTDGYKSEATVTTHNWGFSSPGVIDPQGVTKRVSVSISSSYTNGSPNPLDPLAGYNYENPMICDGYKHADDGSACCNDQPTPMDVTLRATVTGLDKGVEYVLYEYVFDGITGVGSDAALNVPTENFNANAHLASFVTTFVGDSSGVYEHYVERTSDKIVVFRCVPASAP